MQASFLKNNTLSRCTILQTNEVWKSKENRSYKSYWDLVFDSPDVNSIDIVDIFLLGPYQFATTNWKIFVRKQ